MLFRNIKFISTDNTGILAVESVPLDWKQKQITCRISNAAGSATTSSQLKIDADLNQIQAGTFEVISTQNDYLLKENAEALLIGDSFAEVASLFSNSTLSPIETYVNLSSDAEQHTVEHLEDVVLMFTRLLPNSQYFREHDEVILRCSVLGAPRPAVKWTHNGNLIPINKFEATVDENGNAELRIFDLSRHDAGIFTCTASNQCSVVTTECVMSVEAVDEYRFEVRLQVLSMKEVTASVLELDISEQIVERVEGKFEALQSSDERESKLATQLQTPESTKKRELLKATSQLEKIKQSESTKQSEYDANVSPTVEQTSMHSPRKIEQVAVAKQTQILEQSEEEVGQQIVKQPIEDHLTLLKTTEQIQQLSQDSTEELPTQKIKLIKEWQQEQSLATEQEEPKTTQLIQNEPSNKIEKIEEMASVKVKEEKALDLSQQVILTIDEVTVELQFNQRDNSKFVEVVLEDTIESVDTMVLTPETDVTTQKQIKRQPSLETQLAAIKIESEALTEASTQQKQAVADVDVDLQFKTQVCKGFSEVVLEGSFDEVQLKVKKPAVAAVAFDTNNQLEKSVVAVDTPVVEIPKIQKREKPEKAPTLVLTETPVEIKGGLAEVLTEASVQQVDEQDSTVSEINLKFKTQIFDDFSEVVLEDAANNVQLNTDEFASIEEKTDQQRVVQFLDKTLQESLTKAIEINSADIELLFKCSEQFESLEVVVEGVIEYVQITCKEPKSFEIAPFVETFTQPLKTTQNVLDIERVNGLVFESELAKAVSSEVKLDVNNTEEQKELLTEVQYEQKPNTNADELSQQLIGDSLIVKKPIEQIDEKLVGLKQVIEEVLISPEQVVDKTYIESEEFAEKSIQPEQVAEKKTIVQQLLNEVPTEAMVSESFAELIFSQKEQTVQIEVVLETAFEKIWLPNLKEIKEKIVAEQVQPDVEAAPKTYKALDEKIEAVLKVSMQSEYEIESKANQLVKLDLAQEQIIKQQPVLESLSNIKDPLISDVQIEIVFKQIEPSVFVEVILEGSLEEVEFKERELKISEPLTSIRKLETLLKENQEIEVLLENSEIKKTSTTPQSAEILSSVPQIQKDEVSSKESQLAEVTLDDFEKAAKSPILSESKKPIVSDFLVNLVFSRPEDNAAIEAVLYNSYEEAEMKMQQPKMSKVEIMTEELFAQEIPKALSEKALPAEISADKAFQLEPETKNSAGVLKTPAVDIEVELRFQQAKQFDELEVILENEFVTARAQVKDAKSMLQLAKPLEDRQMTVDKDRERKSLSIDMAEEQTC